MEWEIEFIDESVINTKKKEITKEIIERIIKDKFTWIIKQTPTKYSAIKIDWKKAYELVRKWVSFEMKEREIIIKDPKVIKFEFPFVKCEMTVSAWTYIRNIAEDIWKELWLGWYVTMLHRSKIWDIDLKKAKEVDDIKAEDCILETELFPEVEVIELDSEQIEDVLHWRKAKIEEIHENKRYLLSSQWKIISFIEWNKNWWYNYLANEL